MTPEARIVSALAAGIVIGAAVGASAIKQPVTEAAAGASCPLAAKPMVRLEMMFGWINICKCVESTYDFTWLGLSLFEYLDLGVGIAFGI